MLSQHIQWHIYFICLFILYLKDIWFLFSDSSIHSSLDLLKSFNIQFCLMISHSGGMAGSCSTRVLKMIRNLYLALQSFWCSVHQGLLAKVLISWRHLHHFVVWHFHMFNFRQSNTSSFVFLYFHVFLIFIYFWYWKYFCANLLSEHNW